MSQRKTAGKRRVTLQAVADLAGVNRVTAGVALRQSSNGGTRVSAETRQRVRAAAQQLGYAPNALARALRGERTQIIGYYSGYETSSPNNPFFTAILEGLQRRCRHYRQDLILFGSFERDSAESIFATFTNGKIDGLLLLPTPHSPILDRLFDSHLPVVALVNAHPAVPSVVADDFGGSRRIAQYLAQQGHQRILYRSQADKRTSVVRRQEAFLAAAATLGMDVTVTYEADGHQLTDQELAIISQPAGQRPSAAVCWMDLNAYALLAACQAIGLAVPGDLAIIGFDGVPMRIPPARSLTTMRAPWSDVAARAVDQLMALLDGHTIPSETVLPVELVVGDTA